MVRACMLLSAALGGALDGLLVTAVKYRKVYFSVGTAARIIKIGRGWGSYLRYLRPYMEFVINPIHVTPYKEQLEEAEKHVHSINA